MCCCALAELALTEGFSVVVGFAGVAGDWGVGDSVVAPGFWGLWPLGLCCAQTEPKPETIAKKPVIHSFRRKCIGNDSSFPYWFFFLCRETARGLPTAGAASLWLVL
jgi:hypothetical protein